MADKAKDLVISYAVQYGKIDETAYPQLQQALDNGYRVVDVIATPQTVGGGGGGYGPVIVTVLLSAAGTLSEYWRKSPRGTTPDVDVGVG